MSDDSAEYPDFRLGEHVPDKPVMLPGNLGSKENPYTVAPADFDTEGLPYACWCRCATCGEMGRSSFAFDFYAKGPGQPLVCETCSRIEWAKA